MEEPLMTGKIKLLYSADLAKIFGGDEKWHKRILKNKYEIRVPKQYIHTSATGEIGLYENGLTEYENVFILLVGMTKTHPWRHDYYSIDELGDQFGLSRGNKFNLTLAGLYEKIESGIDCGLKKGDIIKAGSRQRRYSGHSYVYYLKKDALQKFSEIVREPLSGQYVWLGYMDLRKLGYGPQAKIPEVLQWAYDQVQQGNDIGLSSDDIRTSKNGNSRFGVAYQIKSTALDAFVAATGLRNPTKDKMQKQDELKEENKIPTKVTEFKSASQKIRDAWGYEWTTTYSRMPLGKDDR